MSLVNFAVVREDPHIEEQLIKQFSPSKTLIIASGGCTALHLLTTFPGIHLTLFDTNAAQLHLIQRKINSYNTRTRDYFHHFNIETDTSLGLNQLGAFESLFRSFRHFIHTFVMDYTGLRVLLSNPGHTAAIAEMFSSPYWPVAFELFFSDSLLNAMFGPAATQNAAKGSYPAYFQQAFQTAMLKPNACNNYFLHHVFLGCYLSNPNALPSYLTKTVKIATPSMRHCDLYDINNLDTYDLVCLSNILDWMNIEQATRLANHLNTHAKQNALILIRQLNSTLDMSQLFGSGFSVNHALGNAFLQSDRSMFYSTINLLCKR